MKNEILTNTKKFAKVSQKVFTKKKQNDTIRKSHIPLKVNYKIYKRRDGLYMKNEELNKTRIVDFIDEKSYQHIKKNMGKNSDYFTQKELEKIGVILA